MRVASSVARAPTPARREDVGSEFAFDDTDFERARRLIHDHAGISLQPGKQAMVYGRLSRRLRETGYRSVGGYLQWLEAAGDTGAVQERQAFINSLTTNLTSFFREPHHFDLLADTLKASAGQPVRIWCAAASTGEEPCTLAMTAIEALGPRPNVTIVASDIDTQVLATAATGVYPVEARGLSPERRRRHFERGTGSRLGSMRLKPEIARLIEFRALNLMDARWALGEPFDIVFCRNVMIYFDRETQRRVLGRLHGAMRADGRLFVGHAETIRDMNAQFRLAGQTVYVRL